MPVVVGAVPTTAVVANGYAATVRTTRPAARRHQQQQADDAGDDDLEDGGITNAPAPENTPCDRIANKGVVRSLITSVRLSTRPGI
jgi:hypothetical protein